MLIRVFITAFTLFVLMTPNAQAKCQNDLKSESLATSFYDDDFVKGWAATAATETMTFGFHDYKMRLEKSSRFFTVNGWKSFVAAMQKAKMIEILEARQKVIFSTATSSSITKKESINGIYTWWVDIALTVTYQAGSEPQQQFQTISAMIVRSNEDKNEDGIAIQGWVAVER